MWQRIIIFYFADLHNSIIFSNTNCGGIMEEKDIKLLNRLYQDAEIGMMSVDKVLKKVKDGALKNLLVKHYDMFFNFKVL